MPDDGEFRARQGITHVGCAEVGIGREAKSQDGTAATAGLGEDMASGVIEVKDAHPRDGTVATIEEDRLGVQVGSEVAMVVDVIAREVREGGGGKMESMHAVLVERMRTHLEASPGTLSVGHLAEKGREVG